ncbi:MAG: hypothetical protein DI547_03155 [Sphingobium sp.]|nr:MAG: hypothetical protein DI547_03155 [Sphingobium sp.]
MTTCVQFPVRPQRKDMTAHALRAVICDRDQHELTSGTSNEILYIFAASHYPGRMKARKQML